MSDAPARQPDATPAAYGRGSAVWLYAAIAVIAAALASVVSFRK